MKKLKKRRKLIIILGIVGVIAVMRIFLFESVHLHSYLSYFSSLENYEKYFLFEGKVRRRHSSFTSSYMQEDEYILMFQWQYDKMVEEMQKELYERLDGLVESYEFVSGYKVSEPGKVLGKVIDIYYDEQMEKTYYDQKAKVSKGLDFYYGIKSEVGRRIGSFCELQALLTKSDDWCTIRLHDSRGQKEIIK